MKVLGIETSCDETAAAIVEDGTRILSNVVVSQIDIHRAYGGVVPEVAARSHIEAIIPVIDDAVRPVGWDEIDAIAVTNRPGLVGSLLIGTLTARTLALTKNKPLYPVHHVEAHVYASFLGDNVDGLLTTSSSSKAASPPGLTRASRRARLGAADALSKLEVSSKPQFPILALIVSGGHTQIVLFRDHGNFTILGQTRDDAVGEAFDKVAKILGLSYPGGPAIATAAEYGNSQKYHLPKSKMQNPYDFSFSGLKTAVLRAVQAECGKKYDFPSSSLAELLDESQRNDFAASFQKTAVETLVDNIARACREYRPKSVVVAGGVAANLELRRQMNERLLVEPVFPAPAFCTDNAAMVASLGYYRAQKDAPANPLDVEVSPSAAMTSDGH